jgi:hypothetical protein
VSEDGCSTTGAPRQSSREQGGRLLRSPGGKALAKTFLLSPKDISRGLVYPSGDRLRLIDQLTIALKQFYVHLTRKRAIYGFDPVRALQLLRLRIDQLSDGDFHQSIAEIIARVRDRHVMIYGRAPYGTSAFVPFTVESCWIEGSLTYIVSKIDDGFTPKALQPGARVSHWNGVPVDGFVRLNANLFDGGNEAASLARSLAFLTHRPLREFGAPLEEYVDLRFSINGAELEERFFWFGLDMADIPTYPSLGRNVTGFGGDPLLMELQSARRVRFAPRTFDEAVPAIKRDPSTGVPIIEGSGASGVFDYGTVTTKDGTFAYLRFWSFHADDADDLVNALLPVLPKLPQTGLILDIRGNTGGRIAAGERILQLFSPRPIVPARFQFRVTSATRAMVQASDDFARWRASFTESFDTGEEYTQGFPIEDNDEDFNKVGQKYRGPVVVISDALAYSTADIFAAGFLDNGVGQLICTDANMAAAGGNNWVPWDVVRLYNPDFKLDQKFKVDVQAGHLSSGIFDAFNLTGVSLSQKAVLSQGNPEYDGTSWVIQDGAIKHLLRDLPWMGPSLAVYLARSPIGMADMPAGITLSVTMRRSLRVKENEGRVLEDIGIVPNISYRMTFRDVMEQNQDLFVRAGEALASQKVT